MGCRTRVSCVVFGVCVENQPRWAYSSVWLCLVVFLVPPQSFLFLCGRFVASRSIWIQLPMVEVSEVQLLDMVSGVFWGCPSLAKSTA